MPRIVTCVVLTAGRSKRMGIDEALRLRPAGMACPGCHQPVRAHKEGTTGQAAHFEHMTRNDMCAWDES